MEINGIGTSNEELSPEERVYTIFLADGTKLTNLRLNGNNFISETPVTQEMFIHNLGSVTISDGEIIERHINMDLVQITQMGDEYWFVLRDITEEEMMQAKLRADLDYLFMMTGLTL